MGQDIVERLMHEDDITDRILDCLKKLTPRAQRAFVREALGVRGITPGASSLEIYHRTHWLDGRRIGATIKDLEPRAVLVVVAGDAFIDHRDVKDTGGSIVDGVLLWRDDLIVLLEAKKAGNPVSRKQVLRHANAWGIKADRLAEWNDVVSPPGGFGFSSWTAVLTALNSLIDGAADAGDAERLQDLAHQLDEVRHELVAGPLPDEPADARPVAITELPTPVDLHCLLSDVDLDEVWRVCRELYRPGGVCEVTEKGCVEDALKLRDAYLVADGLAEPPGLSETSGEGVKHDVMTPARMLTCAVQGTYLRMLGPQSARELRRRLLGRGGDRLTIVALWAWATQGRQNGYKKHCAKALPHLWTKAEPTPIATKDLFDRLSLPDDLFDSEG